MDLVIIILVIMKFQGEFPSTQKFKTVPKKVLVLPDIFYASLLITIAADPLYKLHFVNNSSSKYDLKRYLYCPVGTQQT